MILRRKNVNITYKKKLLLESMANNPECAFKKWNILTSTIFNQITKSEQ